MVGSISQYISFPSQWPFGGSKEVSPFANKSRLDDVIAVLRDPKFTFDQLKSWKKDLKKIIENPDNKHDLERFISDILMWGIPKNPQGIIDLLTETLNFEAVKAIAQERAQDKRVVFTSTVDIAKEMVENFPPAKQGSYTDKFYSELRKFKPTSLYLIPNVIHIFIEFFSYFNTSKKYTTFWEKQMIVDMVLKLTLLVQALNPILVTPTKVYAVALLIIMGVEVVAIAFQRWFKPMPNDIVNCTNLDRRLEMGCFKPKVGQSEVLNRLIQALVSNQKVLLVGLSGEGKTALISQLVQMKKEGTLTKELAELAFFTLKCGDIMGHGTFGQAEMINQTKEKIEGIEKKLLLFFDDLDQFTNKGPDATSLENFKKLFLNDDEHSPRVVAATTVKGYEKLKKLDEDGSFMQRVVPIVVESASDDQCRLVVSELLKRKARDLPVTDLAIEKAIEVSKVNAYLPDIGRIAKIKKIMEAVIAKSHAGYQSDFATKSLLVTRDKYKALEMDVTLRWKKDPTKIKNRNLVFADLTKAEKKVDDLRKQAQKVKDVIHHKALFDKQQDQLATKLVNSKKVPQDVEKRYLLSHFWAEDAFEKTLKKEIEKIEDIDSTAAKEMGLEINGELVQNVFEELKAEQVKLQAL